MRQLLDRLQCESAGRTLAEMLVAIAITAMVVGLISSTHVAAMRWAQRDRQTATVNRPLREASNFMTRDIEFASETTVSSGQLIITLDRRQPDNSIVQDTVTYAMVGSNLRRTLVTAEGTTTVFTVTTGLGTFEPSVTASGLVRVRFGATSAGVGGESRNLLLEILPRKGVGGL